MTGPRRADLIRALKRLRSAGYGVLSAMDDHNATHGSYLGGASFFELGRAIHAADQAMSGRNSMLRPILRRLRGFIFWTPVVALAACSTTAKAPVPPQAAEARPVYIPVPKACEVEKVQPSELPSAGGVGDDLYEAVKRVLADRAVLLGDREKLVAANSDPCPEGRK